MAAYTTIRRELLNARVYFIPAGEVVDANPALSAITTWPDNSPTTNYTAFQLQDTETLKVEREFEEETFKIPKAAGGYMDDVESTLKKVTYTGSTAKTNSLLKQLEHGLASQPVVGTAQSPFARNDDFVEGLAFIELQNKTGVVTERIQVWSRIRLTDPGEVGPNTKKLTYTLEVRDSTQNSYLLVA
jgi:hypothetical protein